jgi:hypothetical protein
MTDVELRIRLRDLLYRTRGSGWDYAFLLQPDPLIGEGWYTLHRRIFANVEPSADPVVLRGTLGIGIGHPFLACAFADPQLRDHQGRAIAHYLVWLGLAAEAAPGASIGPGLVQALRPALDSVFQLSPQQLVSDRDLAFDTLLRRRFREHVHEKELHILASVSGPVRWLGTVAPW